ncbi:cell division protein FtsK [Actinoplanes sp. NPDC051494]|uniref:cell division protein FtsK n=1 Tax=Actinoplanes sp. NPDC051494 TaxID=3363907 RepID=UPI0037B5865F
MAEPIEAYDAETVDATPGALGAPVDPPARPPTFADVVTRADERRPIVPASLRSRAGRHALVVWLIAAATHGLLFHLTRSPKYAGKIVLWAPVGLWLAIWRPLRWATAEDGNRHLRKEAENRGDIAAWLQLDARRMQQAPTRFKILGVVLVLLSAACLAGRFLAPTWAQAMTITVGVMVMARVGRPADRPILDRVFNASRFVRLTAELTRAALVAAGAGIKDPAGVRFDKEIYRDGPGYTAQVTLPVGIIASDVIERRDYLAAGFQLPIAQVWPEPVEGAHPGVLGIWVADRPVDRMKQPVSPLIESGSLDFWGPLPYGTDNRMRPLFWRLDERNSLFGGMPGSGKTLAARNVALGAALDPLVQFAISELKGSGDFDAFEPLCGEGMYASGADDATKQRTMAILRWLDRECERRGPLIRKWAAQGLNRDNKLNRAIALADPSLRPILAVFDEIQELFTDPDLGKDAKALGISVVKRGRSLGIHLIFASQRIDTQSVPKGVSSNVSNRLCLAVPSHVEVELVLGTGSYKAGSRPTTFIPPAHGVNTWAGWGYLAGLQRPVRAAYIDNETAEQIVARARALRGDLVPVDLEQESDRDVLADVIRVFAHLNRPGLQWQQLAELLAEQMPGLYAGITAEAVSAEVRAQGVPSVDVKAGGQVAKGCRRDALDEALTRRELGS